jgi:hypothetical protein
MSRYQWRIRGKIKSPCIRPTFIKIRRYNLCNNNNVDIINKTIIKENTMKKAALFISSAILITSLLLAGCAGTEYVTVTNTSTITNTTSVTTTATTTIQDTTTITKTVTTNIVTNRDAILEQLAQSDEGLIDLGEYGPFYYKLFEGEIDEDIVFHDVTFTRTVIQTLLPIVYCIKAGYVDGTDELITHNGTVDDYYGIYFDFGQHEDPPAGVMMVLYDDTESGEHVLDLYVLVAQPLY